MPETGRGRPLFLGARKGALEGAIWGAVLGGPVLGLAAMFAGPSGGADSFCIAGEVDDAVFCIRDCIDDSVDAGRAKPTFAGWAGASHSERAVVANAGDPDCGAGS